MSKKTLMTLAGVLAALVVAWWWTGGRGTAPSGTDAAANRKLLPAVDVNAIRAVAIEDGAATTHLAKADGVWRLEEQGGYPADFNRLREMMRSIDGTENAQIADAGSDHLADFGLAADSEPAPLRIALEQDAGTTVLCLGKRREPPQNGESWTPAAGRYVRVDAGPVLLIKDDIQMADADPAKWWDRVLLEWPPESVRRVEIGAGDEAFAIERGTNGTYALAGAAENEEVDLAAANRLFGALRNLRAEKILPANEADAAFQHELAFATDGATCRIQIGEAQAAASGGRPVKIEMEGDVPSALAEKLKDRTFLVTAYLVDPLLQKKSVLVHVRPAPVPEPAPASEAAPAPPPVPEDVPAEEPDPGASTLP